LSIKEQLANLTREERIDYLKEEQKRISEKFKSTEETKRLMEQEGDMIDPDTYYQNQDKILN
jgi:hypothetical protein